MRRGHPGHLGLGSLSGWRNENPRHFRPRTGGNPHFRPPRGYGLLDQHRFPPPVSRPHRPLHPFKQRAGGNEHMRHDHQDRGNYRSEYRQNHYPRNYEGDHQPGEKQIYPTPHHSMRPSEPSYGNTYPKASSNYYEGSSKQCHMNNMGDIDDRYIPPREPFRQHPINPWTSHSNVNQFDDRHKYEHNKSHRYEGGESSKILHDYAGHRPPSNDHYGGNPTPVINNSDSFNRSVDDTVNIIRKRLMNRSEASSEPLENNYDQPAANQTVEKTKEPFQPEQAAKKKVHRPRHSDKSSSDTSFTKIKSKIVNQFLKMDKEKIHKLMDNPTSSSKFEYAIDSLITESQYSFNRHLRSVAEKSLHTSSSIDFIQDDNNTIYEDTFMKQMQCILDPQDTILLEDIKPIVMAELSKALQLDEYEHRLEVRDDINYQQRHQEPNYNDEYYDNLYNYDESSQYSSMSDQKVDLKHTLSKIDEQPESIKDIRMIDHNDSKSHENNESYFDNRSKRKSQNISPEKMDTPESPPHSRKSLDERLSELHFSAIIGESEPDNRLFDTKPEETLFKANIETPLEDEDDPFAELDKQYHVAVDHSFIENDEDDPSLHLEKDSQVKAPNIATNIALNLNTSEKDAYIIKEEIDHQLQDMALSSLELPLYSTIQTRKIEEELMKISSQSEKSHSVITKNERKLSCDNIQTAQLTNPSHIDKTVITNLNEGTESKKINKDIEKSDTSVVSNKCSVIFPSRKRSIDISPSHSKEKRRKSESAYHQPDKQIQQRHTNVIVNIQENSSKCSKKDDKRNFSEKHTKRKESHKKTDSKENESRKKVNTTESPNCSFSPKESNSVVNSNKVHNKTECKNTLKTFDIFSEQPKKVTNLHQSHRNTALPSIDNSKTISQSKNKQSNKAVKKHVDVQVEKKAVCNKEVQTTEQRSTSTKVTQTDKKRQAVKATQTDAVINVTKKEASRSTDALERMKEIDMEIQALLQEKFKIYSSIESKETGTNSLHTLGMAVVNVSPTEDAIVDDFTSIPVEELEQIALESIDETPADSKPETRNRRRTLSKEKSKSQSPTPAIQKKNNKKGKTPNISLIEQIISDDRPIEDIISFDDLEESSIGKSRGKNIKSRRKLRRKGPIRSQSSTPTAEPTEYVLKDCAVLIVREDFSKYFANTCNEEEMDISHSPQAQSVSVIRSQNDIPVEEVNDIQFDMLDVSEDIVIGDICEVKSIEDKEDTSNSDVQCISEEIILDNSQSSLEDQQGSTSDAKENECKMIDYSSDENLRQDSIIVTGAANADAILAIECIENNFLAASLDGNVYYFSGDGQLITTLKGSNLAVTCLTIVKEKYGTTVYTGSLDSRIRYYDLETGVEKGLECNVLSPIQTMDLAWDTVFVGTRTGFVLQFECKNNMLIPVSTVQFSEQSILALRAMKEGPRKVLLVAARSEDVTIKDAQSGLLLRTLAGPKMTVYTLLYEDGKVYCGTSSSQIHVFDYTSGTHVGAHEGGKGAVCLRAAGGLVFAGCYDGCVYVYREGERQPFAQLRGPSLMLLSLAVVGTKIIAGFKDRSLYIWKIPLSILQEMIL